MSGAIAFLKALWGGYGTNDGFFVCFIPNVHPKVNSADIDKGLHFNWISRRGKFALKTVF